MKKDKIIVVFLILLLLIIGILLYYNNKKVPLNPESSIEPTYKIKNKEVIFNKYTYTIDINQNYLLDDTNENVIRFYGKDGKWYAVVEIVHDYADKAFENPEMIHDLLINNGYEVGNTSVLTIQGNDIITFDYHREGYVAVIAYMRGLDNDLYEITVYDEVNDMFYYENLGDVIKILNTGNSKE